MIICTVNITQGVALCVVSYFTTLPFTTVNKFVMQIKLPCLEWNSTPNSRKLFIGTIK